MGSGEMMLTIVGMMLLGNIILTANWGINNIQQTMLNTGYEVAAISLARTTIEKAQELPFEQSYHGLDLGKLIEPAYSPCKSWPRERHRGYAK